jgi:naphthalene 1,2-dioxygenase system ferredoxin subunit
VGRYLDLVVPSADGLRIAERICVDDSDLIAGHTFMKSSSISSRNWVDVVALDDLWESTGHGTVVAGHDIALFRIGEVVHVIDNLCNHGHARLCEGFVEGHEIECPLHRGRFDLRTGAPTCAPVTDAIRTYPVRIHAGPVLVALD